MSLSQRLDLELNRYCASLSLFGPPIKLLGPSSTLKTTLKIVKHQDYKISTYKNYRIGFSRPCILRHVVQGFNFGHCNQPKVCIGQTLTLGGRNRHKLGQKPQIVMQARVSTQEKLSSTTCHASYASLPHGILPMERILSNPNLTFVNLSFERILRNF